MYNVGCSFEDLNKRSLSQRLQVDPAEHKTTRNTNDEMERKKSPISFIQLLNRRHNDIAQIVSIRPSLILNERDVINDTS